jgi:hypothetical protein
MKGLKLFWTFFKNAGAEVLENKPTYIGAFVALFLLGNVETIFPLIGATPESMLSIIFSIFTTLMTFIVLSQVVLIQKKSHGGSGELKYFVPTFLLYNLYYSFMFFLGLLCLVVPGFYILIYFSMVPFIAVLDDESKGQYFKESKLLVRKNLSLVAWLCLINLILEFSVLLLLPVENSTTKAVANLIFSIPDAFLTLVMTVTSVKIYYFLKRH